MGSHSERHVCRLCYGPTRVMLSLTPTPIANSFPAHPDKDAERFPLDIAECVDCGHVQQDYQATIDWVDYRYKTPDANRQHLKEAAIDLRQRYPWAKTVMEIGSNNGLYLEELRKVGLDAFGVDPNAKYAKSDISAPFSSALAYTLPQVDIIVANNVLAHVDDLWDVFRGIDRMLGMDGVLVFEVQDYDCMTQTGAFDMMYHEHRDYHSREPLHKFMKRWGLEIEHCISIPTHGGSFRYHCRRPHSWRKFSDHIKREKYLVQAQLLDVDGTVACFGATAKACTLIHHFGLADKIDYCVDDTPEKQGRYIPGTNIQIFPTSHLQEVPPKALLMTAWNFKDVLLKKYPNLPWIIPFEEGAYAASR
jgi:SAM-dependent methyltransferase